MNKSVVFAVVRLLLCDFLSLILAYQSAINIATFRVIPLHDSFSDKKTPILYVVSADIGRISAITSEM